MTKQQPKNQYRQYVLHIDKMTADRVKRHASQAGITEVEFIKRAIYQATMHVVPGTALPSQESAGSA